MTEGTTATADDTRIGDHSEHPARNVAAEFTGVLILMLFGPGVIVLTDGRASDLAAAIGFGAGVAIAIGVIGAVANPAFTLALVFIRSITWREAIADWLGQFLGGIAGAAAIWGINDMTRSELGANGWDRDGYAQLGSVMAAELIFGVVIVVVLLSAITQGRSTAAVAGFTGVAYAAAHLILIPGDGGGLNPARSLGSALFSDTEPSALSQVWLFVLVPLIAAIAAVFIWLVIDEAEIDDTILDDTFVDDAANALTGDDD
jgi:aquaporin Z